MPWLTPPRYTLSRDDVVLRGCEREPPQRVLASMREHYLSPRTPAEWGLSVAAMPQASEKEILRNARQLRQSFYRVAQVGDIHDLSEWDLESVEDMSLNDVSVSWDHNAHGLILSHMEPTMELAASICGLFGPPRANPFYEERKRRHAGR